MSSYMASKKTLELNPSNAIVKELKEKVKANRADKSVRGSSFDFNISSFEHTTNIYNKHVLVYNTVHRQ
jgi:hypothetical protein